MMGWIGRAFLAVAVVGAISACGSSEETIADKWSTYCDSSADVEASNCPDNMDTSGLTMFCKMVGTSFYDTPECNTQLDALMTCSDTREWECWEGGEVPQVVQPDPCEVESEPFTIPDGSCVDPSKVSVSSEGG